MYNLIRRLIEPKQFYFITFILYSLFIMNIKIHYKNDYGIWSKDFFQLINLHESIWTLCDPFFVSVQTVSALYFERQTEIHRYELIFCKHFLYYASSGDNAKTWVWAQINKDFNLFMRASNLAGALEIRSLRGRRHGSSIQKLPNYCVTRDYSIIGHYNLVRHPRFVFKDAQHEFPDLQRRFSTRLQSFHVCQPFYLWTFVNFAIYGRFLL